MVVIFKYEEDGETAFIDLMTNVAPNFPRVAIRHCHVTNPTHCSLGKLKNKFLNFLILQEVIFFFLSEYQMRDVFSVPEESKIPSRELTLHEKSRPLKSHIHT